MGFRTWAAELPVHTQAHLVEEIFKSADYCVSCPFVFLLPVKVWSRSASMKLHEDSSSILSFRVHAVSCTNVFKCSFVSAILFSLTS